MPALENRITIVDYFAQDYEPEKAELLIDSGNASHSCLSMGKAGGVLLFAGGSFLARGRRPAFIE